VLLRGINIGPRKRVAMPELRKLLGEAGFDDVRTYVQSGNVVLSSALNSDTLTETCEHLIAERFGFQVDVVTRTQDELAKVVERNPFKDVAEDPKLYQVTLLADEPDAHRVEKLASLIANDEQFVVIGREAYAWHPKGAARSKLWNAIASDGFGVTATSRNWKTVTTLLALAEE
jgi:uncharacterized protein (DUF1697 family)